MSEEIKRNELNDDMLENVSGGGMDICGENPVFRMWQRVKVLKWDYNLNTKPYWSDATIIRVPTSKKDGGIYNNITAFYYDVKYDDGSIEHDVCERAVEAL